MPRDLANFPDAYDPEDPGRREPIEKFTEQAPEKVTRLNINQRVITKALTALAWRAGTYSNAIRDLDRVGIVVTRQQLVSWSTGEHADLYNKIRDDYSRTSEAEMVREMRETIHQASEAERLAIEKTVEGFASKTVGARDASQAAFNLARVKKENVDKLQTLLGRPTQIIEDRSAEAALKKLIARKILRPVIHEDDE